VHVTVVSVMSNKLSVDIHAGMQSLNSNYVIIFCPNLPENP